MRRPITADVVSELLRLKRRNGLLRAQDVVKAARPARSPLHRFFEWNVRKAAMVTWIEQARELIQVAVTVEPGLGKVHVFVSLRPNRVSGGYREMAEVLRRPDLRRILLEDALRDIEALHTRYVQLRELQPVWGAAASVASALNSHRRAAR